MAMEQAIPESIRFLQDYVNSLELEHGPDQLGDIEPAAVWLKNHGLTAAGLTSEALEELRRLRESLRMALLANNGTGDPVASWEELSRLVSGTPVTVQLGEMGDVRLCPVGEDGGSAVRAAIGAAIYEAAREGTWRRLKACRRGSCLWAFYDQSKNGSGSWCSMAVCGNREKAQRRRRRSSEENEGSTKFRAGAQ